MRIMIAPVIPSGSGQITKICIPGGCAILETKGFKDTISLNSLGSHIFGILTELLQRVAHFHKSMSFLCFQPSGITIINKMDKNKGPFRSVQWKEIVTLLPNVYSSLENMTY